MKFVAHAKTFKPDDPVSDQNAPLFAGHAHVHTPPHLIDGVMPIVEKDHAYFSYGDPNWSPTKKYVDDVLDAQTTVHPKPISISEALDALKAHGVFFTGVSSSYSPQNGMELTFNVQVAAGPETQYVASELHKWLYSPGKGY